jgi:hypothetical protein
VASKEAQAREVLESDRDQMQRMVQGSGADVTRKLLQSTQKDLEKRLREAEGLRGPGKGSFTAVQLRATLKQVRHLLVQLNRSLKNVIVDHGKKAAELAAGNTAKYLIIADQAYRGVGTMPLALDLAELLGSAMSETEASILRRIASGLEGHPGKEGVLARYGSDVIEHFEKKLQKGIVGRKSLDEMREDITAESPFLQGAPRHWADRIVRTELAGAHNRAQWESVREADDQLGDMVKILSATFDERTAADSYAVHGQIRRPEEAFETWQGLFQHPPARPNDREVVTPHRISWSIPPYLAWRDDAEVFARWLMEHPPPKKPTGRSRARMPPRPLMTTVPLDQFGKPPEESKPEQEEGATS